MTRLTLEIPEWLAQEARAAGLLSPEAVADLLREEVLRRQAGRTLGEIMDRLHAAAAGDGLTDDARLQLVTAAVAAVRAGHKAGPNASGA